MKSGVKVNVDLSAYERLRQEALKSALNDGLEVACVHCGQSFVAKGTVVTCPHCGKDFKIELMDGQT